MSGSIFSNCKDPFHIQSTCAYIWYLLDNFHLFLFGMQEKLSQLIYNPFIV